MTPSTPQHKRGPEADTITKTRFFLVDATDEKSQAACPEGGLLWLNASYPERVKQKEKEKGDKEAESDESEPEPEPETEPEPVAKTAQRFLKLRVENVVITLSA